MKNIILVIGLLICLVALGQTETTAALVASWSMNEGSGTTITDEQSSIVGTINGATWTVDGRQGSALVFDGVNDWVDAPYKKTTFGYGTGQPNEASIEAWIKTNNASTEQYAVMLEDTDKFGLAVGGNTVQGRVATTPGGLTEHFWGVSAPVSSNVWYHVVITFKPSEGAKIYVDGVLKNTANPWPGELLRAGWGDLHYIGRHAWYANKYFNGVIDQVKLYNHALSAAEVKSAYDKYFVIANITVTAPGEAALGALRVTPQTVNLASKSDEVRASYSIGAVNVTLDGTGSTGGPPLTYAWKIIGGLLAEPLTPDTSIVNLVLLPGYYHVELVVNDGVQDSEPAEVDFTISMPGFSSSVTLNDVAPSSAAGAELTLSIPFSRDALELSVGAEQLMILEDAAGGIGTDTIDVIDGSTSRGKSNF